MADLKPCPFCGGEAKIIPEQVDARTVVYNFVCQNYDCGCNVYFDYSDREESIEAWNTRKPMEAVTTELEKLKDNDGGCDGVSCDNCKYKESCLEGEEAYKVALDNAIEIVRGKE